MSVSLLSQRLGSQSQRTTGALHHNRPPHESRLTMFGIRAYPMPMPTLCYYFQKMNFPQPFQRLRTRVSFHGTDSDQRTTDRSCTCPRQQLRISHTYLRLYIGVQRRSRSYHKRTHQHTTLEYGDSLPGSQSRSKFEFCAQSYKSV